MGADRKEVPACEGGYLYCLLCGVVPGTGLSACSLDLCDRGRSDAVECRMEAAPTDT